MLNLDNATREELIKRKQEIADLIYYCDYSETEVKALDDEYIEIVKRLKKIS